MLQEQQYGADYLIANKDNFTALHHSRVNGHKGVVAFLLKKTAFDDLTPEHFQKLIDFRNKGDEIVQSFKRFLNQQSMRNRTTALRDAAMRKQTDAATYILKYGPAYDLVDGWERTALHHAVERWDKDCALALLEYAGWNEDVGGGDRRRLRALFQTVRASGVVEGGGGFGIVLAKR